jgi:hypothetical protein
MKRFLSLGAGVQSSAILLMSCIGELPLLDGAVFADTQWEPSAVYEHLAWLTTFAAKAGITVHRVSQVRGRKTNGHRWASMPLYTKKVWQPCEIEDVRKLEAEAKESGKDRIRRIITELEAGRTSEQRGMIRRQCTNEYKIKPIERFLRREVLGCKPKCRAPKNAIETWIGISMDEMKRMETRKDSYWQIFRYPLIRTMFLDGLGFTRGDCLMWLNRKGFPRPPRSACIGCPFHSDAEWKAIKADPIQWADACEFDDAIRYCGGMRGLVYLHPQRVPLREVNLDGAEACTEVDGCAAGMCGA